MNYKELSQVLNEPQKIQDGAEQSMEALINELIAEEYIQWYQYFTVYLYLVGTPNANEIADKFRQWADDELHDHAERLMNRLNELNMQFTLLTPESWASASTAPLNVAPVTDVINQLRINKDSEMHAITRYQGAIRVAEAMDDTTTADLFKHILADEEEHHSDILDFIQNLQTLNI